MRLRIAEEYSLVGPVREGVGQARTRVPPAGPTVLRRIYGPAGCVAWRCYSIGVRPKMTFPKTGMTWTRSSCFFICVRRQ